MKLVIIGAGGHARVVADILRATGAHQIVGFVAPPRLPFELVSGLPLLGSIEDLAALKARHPFEGAALGVGDNAQRALAYAAVLAAGLEPVSAVHPAAVVCGGVVLGRGVVLAAGAILGTEARLGNDVIVNTGATVDHQCVLADHVHVSPGAHLGGRCSVGAETWIGIGATVIQDLTVGHHVTLGAGATLLSDTPNRVVMVGTPARVIKRKDK